MENIPLITLTEQIKTKQIPSFIEKIAKKINENTTIYILDQNGIQKNKPNICLYQKLSREYNLWIDNGPRNIGDIVDVFMSGANTITIREKYYKNLNINDIKDITENQIFININLEKPTNIFFPNIDGKTLFEKRETIENNPQNHNILKQQTKNTPLHVYENNPQNLKFWETYNIKGIITDINNLKEFKQK
jgi:hypothetical protein